MPDEKRSTRWTVIGVGLYGLIVLGCGGACSAPDFMDLQLSPRARTAGEPFRAGGSDTVAVLIGAGDIGDCGTPGDELTADLIDSLLLSATAPTWVMAIGDNAYERGTPRDYRQCYHPSWGRFRDVTRPVPGNHDYKNGQLLGFVPLFGNADPYFAYFNDFPGQAGEPGDGWYRYRHGVWDVYALNTPGRRHLQRGDRMWNWLEQELARPDRAACAVAYYHYPRFSVGKHRDDERMRDGWSLLADGGVDILVVAHDHNYQSFHPQRVDGTPDARGMRQFLAGTGGTGLRSTDFETIGALDTATGDHWGVLKLVLFPDRYAWEFVTTDGTVFDSGESPCQNPGI